MISIIIPAHNEESVIGLTLAALIEGAIVEEFEVIVVCNGCSDNTAEIVRANYEKVRCIETPVPSKTNALNIGDSVAIGFPRIYLDADVVISADVVRKLSAILQDSKFLAASPRMEVDYSQSSLPVRSYYDVWQQLPYVKEGMIGTGVYALSEKGRRRFEKFPNIIGDDRFIRALFKKNERTTVKECVSTVRAPKTLNGLLKIKTRSRLGGYQFESLYPGLVGNEEKAYFSAVWKSFKKFRFSLSLPIYLFVNILSRIKARRNFIGKHFDYWERDDTSRSGVDKNK